jgi:hypothetical protein
MLEPQFVERYRNKYYGKYRGIVVNRDDPNKQARLLVKVPTIAPRDIITGEIPNTGWAIAGNNGAVSRIPKPGSVVWVEFEEGDVERPIWFPGPYIRQEGTSNATEHTKGEYNLLDNVGRDNAEMPPSKFDGGYGDVEVWESPAGIIEMDSTEGAERININHKSGSRVEILSDGSINIYSKGNKIEAVHGSEKRTIKGSSTITHSGSVVETNEKSRKVTDNKTLEYINLGGASFTYSKDITEVIGGSKIIRVNRDIREVSSGKSTVVLGNGKSLYTGTLEWIVNNLFGQRLPGSTGVKFTLPSLVPGANGFEVNAGLLGAGAQLRIDGLQILLNHIATIALTAPLIRLGTDPISAVNPVAKAIPLVTWLALHVHTSTTPGSPTSPPSPIVPLPIPAIISPTVLVT